MATPQAEVVIAVHDPRRQVVRAARSVLDGTKTNALVTVVCHGKPKEHFAELMQFAEQRAGQVRLLEYSDGIASPAGPFNHGLDEAVAPYVAIMGSDDMLEPGALDAWHRLAVSENADFVFAGMKYQNGTSIVNPQVRSWREKGLDPRKDRLFERSAPLGLMRTALLRQRSMRLAEGLASGEDIEFTAQLIVAAQRIATARKHPKYIIGVDAEDRVTAGHYTAAEMLAPLWLIIRSPWFAELAPDVKASLLTARLRIAVLATIARRTSAAEWGQADIDATREIFTYVTSEAPAALHPLPRSNRNFIDAILADGCDAEQAADAAGQLVAAGRADTLLPRKLRYSLHRDGTLVRYAGYALRRFGA
ncbi:MAG: glycosyltransferase family A protein [Microbacteriaceae bacterium]